MQDKASSVAFVFWQTHVECSLGRLFRCTEREMEMVGEGEETLCDIVRESDGGSWERRNESFRLAKGASTGSYEGCKSRKKH